MTAIAHGSWTHKLGFLADGRLATSGADGVVRCWSRDLELLWEHDANLTACCAGGDLVAGFNGRCGAVVVWDRDGHEVRVLPGHPTSTPCHGAGGNTGCASFSADGSRLATGGFDDVVRLWDTAAGREVGVFPADDIVWSVALSRDGALLAAGTRTHLVHLFDVASGRRLCSAKASRGAVTALAFTPDGVHLITGGGRGEVTRWEIDGSALHGRGEFALHRAGVEGLAVSPCGELGASVSRDGRLQLFALESGLTARTLMIGMGLGVALSPCGARLAVAGPPVAQVVTVGATPDARPSGSSGRTKPSRASSASSASSASPTSSASSASPTARAKAARTSSRRARVSAADRPPRASKPRSVRSPKRSERPSRRAEG